MSGATTIRIAMSTEVPFIFNGGIISATLTGGFGTRTVTFAPATTNTSSSYLSNFSALSAVIPPGTYLGVTITFSGGVTPTPTAGSTVALSGTVIQFMGPPTTTATNVSGLTGNANGTYSGTFNIVIACLHGSSLIQMKEGTKRLDQVKEGDEVLSGPNLDEYTQVKGVAQCWLSFMGVDHDAIIFEPNSLGENEPTKQLIIDPGHPMCTKQEYLENGYDALRPAGTYWDELKGEKVYTKKWTDVFVQEEPSVRYDLILEEPFNTYVANGIVVRSKGYKDHRYQQFV